MLKRLPISILFHATLALMYFPTILFSFVLVGWRTGVISLIALIGLGVLAALDVVIIHRKVNQRAFRAIEIIVIIGLPAVVWPIIISFFSLFSPVEETYLNFNLESKFWPQKLINDLESLQNGVSAAFAITITLAVLLTNATYILYVWIAAVIDELRVDRLRPSRPYWQAQSSSRTGKKWYFFGTQRTPVERAVVVNHCASYIFKKTVFRKHAFEPTGWAILRGVVAVYSCIGILIFSAYSGVSEWQLFMSVEGGVTVQETVTDDSLPTTTLLYYLTSDVIYAYPLYAVASFMRYSDTPPGDVGVITSAGWNNSLIASHIWPNEYDSPVQFNVSWNGTTPLILCMTVANSPGDLQSIQYRWTNGFTLFPLKNYSISLSKVTYTLGSFSWVSYEPDSMDVMPSGSTDTMATFSVNSHQRLYTHRVLISPSPAFLAVAHVISDVGGTFAFIEGLFALIFGRTIMAILFGSRAISPFGLLGIVTRNRFKKLIHEQFPRIQEDIERGGMAAYISEVAIDAALMDVPPVRGQTGFSLSSYTRHEEEGEDAISMGHLRGRSSVSHLQMPYIIEEFQGDLDSHSLLSRRSHVDSGSGVGND
ncbi:hypothetical protein FIBSPDRAFT_1044052 [Athelia psychrophila]|uniref:Uncharacterized protein n=1 Tax=Athelia psychrophila TaxID=1759441 RepID=A0A166KD01_9AGAM|nr:hypothetical protein FIBSPDRAFT_1044052 [Fibularhizoctonia sp. CBS 109695]